MTVGCLEKEIRAMSNNRNHSTGKVCATCDGTGGRRYHWDQDETQSLDCPDCNNGNRRAWDEADASWQKWVLQDIEI